MKSTQAQPVGPRRTGTPTILALAVAAALAGGVPAPADAAGLGRLTVQSALGQPLRAEVEVTSLGLEELGTLSARLAPAEAFRQAGLEYNPALTSLRFAIDRRSNRSAVVRITSTQPINEPFVDLLVELNWASGKFVREYTFLLDPPELRMGRETVAGGTASQQVVPPSVSAAPAPSAQPAPAAPAASTPAAARTPAPRTPAAAPARTVQAAPAPTSTGTPGEVTTRTGDTLASIAARVKPADVSLDQAIIAIYDANPSAFFGSVHQMLAGKRLEVPGRDAMAAVDSAAAQKQILAQAKDFRAYRERLAAAARRVEPAQAGQSAAGTVTARVEDKAAGAAPGDQLKLSRSQGATGKVAGATGSASGASDSSAETQVARDAAVREQQERVSALEKNVADLQQLVELKNKQLAELQRQVEAARAAGTTAAGAVAGAGAAPVTEATPPAAQQAPAAAPATPSAAAPTAAAPTAAAPTTEPAASAAQPATPPAAAAGQPAAPTAEPATAAPAAPATTTAADAQAPVAAKPAPAPMPAPAAEPGFVDQLLANPLTLPGLGAIVLALGAYGMYSVRRRKKAEKFEDDSLTPADAFTANSLFGSTGGQAVDTSNSLFATSTRDSGVDVHSTEVDPIAEAEVYIAYGREAQAEEILKEALKKQPERQAIRLKLLEIYAGRKDPVVFGTLAQEMYDMTGGQNEEWPKVVTLGLSIDPANPLYTGQGDMSAAAPAVPEAAPAAPAAPAAGLSGAAGLAAAAGVAATMLGDRMLPGDEEAARPRGAATGSFAETVPMDGEAAAGEMPDLDFNLDLDTTIGRAASMREAAGIQPESGTPSESDLARAIDGRFELPTLDIEPAGSAFDVGQVSAPAASAGAGEPAALADLGDFKIDLPSLEGLDTRPAIDEGPMIGESAGDLGLAAAETAVAPAVDSSRWQEMATKLDLASAYEEIGDKEGARELLEEVLKGGDTAQQQKARSMLAKIG
ncbi:MAG: pilus assembly protein FimV [Burkholderiaceae bacterium]|nr:pilus assembly protein FimV [Burkholderiaceae bacterium]